MLTVGVPLRSSARSSIFRLFHIMDAPLDGLDLGHNTLGYEEKIAKKKKKVKKLAYHP